MGSVFPRVLRSHVVAHDSITRGMAMRKVIVAAGQIGMLVAMTCVCLVVAVVMKAVRRLAGWVLVAVVITLVGGLFSGCFTTSIFEKLGVTDDFVTTTAKQYAKDYAKEKGYDTYISDTQIDSVVDSAKKALEASTEFQATMTEVASKKASAEKIEELIRTIIDSGAVLPVVPEVIPEATTNTVTQ
jgi:hypothetical protein